MKHVNIGNYSFVTIKNKTVFRSIVAKNDMDAENHCQIIIKKAKAAARLLPKPLETE